MDSNGPVFDSKGHYVDNPVETAETSKPITEWKWVFWGVTIALLIASIVISTLPYIEWYYAVIFWGLLLVWFVIFGLFAWFGNRKA